MKGWTDFFISKPIFSIFFSLLLVIIGIISYLSLSIRLFPKIESSVIEISVDYPGASAETMKSFVTSKILDALNNLESVDYINSSSQAETSTIQIHFKIGSKTENSHLKILEDLSSIRGSLPPDIHEPRVSELQINENPDWLVAFTSSRSSPENLSDFLTRFIKPQCDAIPGVSSVDVLGAAPAIKLEINPIRMAAYGLDSKDIVSALQTQNRMTTSGFIEANRNQFILNVKANMNSIEQLNKIILKNNYQNFVHLSDVSSIYWGPQTDKIQAFYRGSPAVLMSSKISEDENVLSILEKLEGKLHIIESELPNDVSIHELVNGKSYLLSVMTEMLKTFLISLLIVCALTLIFFENLRLAFLIVLCIPISLLGVGVVLWSFGASLNLLTLLAMILVIGLLVDDAIVVLENILRHVERTGHIHDSALLATREITLPVIAMTLTLASLFFPIAFLGGITGKLFFEFAISLVASVLISGFISLSLVPMLSTKILNKNILKGRIACKSRRLFSHLKCLYRHCLRRLFKRKNILLSLWLLLSLLGIYAYAETPKEFAPKQDAGLLEVIANGASSTNTSYLINNARELDKIYQKFTGISAYSVIVGVPSEHQLLSFVRSSTNLRSNLQEEFNKVPNLNAVAIIPSLMPGTQGMPIEFVLESSGNYKELYALANTIIQKGKASGLFLYLEKDLQYDQPSIELNIDRPAAEIMGVSISSIEASIESLLAQNTVQYLSVNGEVYPLIIQSEPSLSQDRNFLTEIYLKNKNQKLIPLYGVVHASNRILPLALNQFQKFNSITISAVMRKPYTISNGIQFFKNSAKSLLPKSISYDFSGNSREFIREGNRLLWLFLASFSIIFMVLALQLESFIDPLIVLLGSVPTALFGALIPLKLGLSSINIYTQIGLLVLSGLISKHGILIVQFANVLNRQGFSKKTAVLKASSIRFRAILMTTLAMVLGALPMIFMKGAGFEARFSFAIVIVPGMLFGTTFSLFVLPILYENFHVSNQKQED